MDLNWDYYNRLFHETLRADASPLEYLIYAGANLQAKNDKGETPLIFALKDRRVSEVNLLTLISYSNKEELDEADNDGKTALQHVVETSFPKHISRKAIIQVRLIQFINNSYFEHKQFRC